MTFEMVGRISPIKDTEKFKGYEEKVSPKGYEGRVLRFNVLTGASKHMLSLSSWVKKDGVIYSFSKPTADGKGESLQIPFVDRLKPEVINSIADFKKMSITLSDNDKYYYISEWDFIEDINTLLHDETNKNKKFKIRGTVEITYNDTTGKWYSNYVPQRIYLIEHKEEYAKLSSVIYFNKDSFDAADTNETGKAYLNAFTREYSTNRKEFLPYPITFVIAKGTPELDKQFDYWKKKFTVSDNTWKEFGIVADMINGAERKEITVDMLDDEQKEEIELGLISFEDIQKEMGGNIIGDVIREYRLNKIMRGYSTGAKETVYTDEDFTIKPVATTVVDKTKDVTVTVNDIEDLFDDEL